MRMVLLTAPDGATARVPEAADYPGYEGWSAGAAEEWPTLAMLKADAWERVKAIRAAHLATAPTPQGTAQTDVESMVKITGLVSMAMIAEQQGAAFAEVFTMADDSEVTMDAATTIQFGLAVGSHVAAVHARGRELRAAIDGAADAAELDAIDLESEWPE